MSPPFSITLRANFRAIQTGTLNHVYRACKKFCVNATEQISGRIFEYDHQAQS